MRKAEECQRSIDQILDSMIREHRANAFDGEVEGLLSVVLRLHAENSISMDTAKAIISVSLLSIIISLIMIHLSLLISNILFSGFVECCWGRNPYNRCSF